MSNDKAAGMTPSAALEAIEIALKQLLAHRHEDKDGNHVMWIGETSFLECEAALNEALPILRTLVDGQPTPRDVFLCRASGEGSHEFRVCNDYEGVAIFFEEQCGRDQDGTLNCLNNAWSDPDEWSNDGTAFEMQLYCATFEVWKVRSSELSTLVDEQRWMPIIERLPKEEQERWRAILYGDILWPTS